MFAVNPNVLAAAAAQPAAGTTPAAEPAAKTAMTFGPGSATPTKDAENIRPHTPSNVLKAGGSTRLRTPKDASWNAMPINEGTDPKFAPTLMSSSGIRTRVRSSGYGVDKVTLKKAEAKDPDVMVVTELGDHAFTPDLKLTAKKRGDAASSGYGTQIPTLRKLAQPTPVFKPDTSITAKKRTKVASSGYGKIAVAAKKVDSAKFAPTFKPSLDVSKKASKMRSEVQPRHTQAPRPKTPGTYDKQRARVKTTPRYTLAADKDAKDASAAAEMKQIGSGFVLDGVAQAALQKGKVSPAPIGSIKGMSLAKKVTKNATSTQYGAGWVPPTAVKVQVKAEPVLALGGKSTYIDRVQDVPSPPKMFNKLHNNVASHYTRDSYQPSRPVTPASTRQTASPDRYFASPHAKGFPSMETLDAPKNKLTSKVSGSGYGLAATAKSAAAAPAVSLAAEVAEPAVEPAVEAVVEATAEPAVEPAVEDGTTTWA